MTLNFLLEVHLAVGLQGDSMKTNYNFCKIFLLIGAISLTNATRGFGQAKDTGGVTINKDAIVMHSGTKLSKDDEKALNDVLKKHDKKLFRVDKIKKGKLTKSIGELKIDAQTESQLAKGTMMGNTVYDVAFSPGPNGRIVIPVQTTVTQKADAQKLIQEVKPILEKYSKP